MSIVRTAAAVLSLSLVAACGGSSTEVRTARSSRYSCDFALVFQAVTEGVAEVFPPLGAVDPGTGMVTSEFRWYELDGTRKQKGMAEVQDRALSIAAIVQLKPVDGGFVVVPTADVRQIRAGLSAAQPLAAESPDRPPWVQGKLDSLAINIHDRLSTCASPLGAPVAAPPAQPAAPAPPADPAPPTDPAAPAPSSPEPAPLATPAPSP